MIEIRYLVTLGILKPLFCVELIQILQEHKNSPLYIGTEVPYFTRTILLLLFNRQDIKSEKLEMLSSGVRPIIAHKYPILFGNSISVFYNIK